MAGQAQKVEELICQTGADSGHPRTEVCLPCPFLKQLPCHTGLVGAQAPHSLIPAADQRKLRNQLPSSPRQGSCCLSPRKGPFCSPRSQFPSRTFDNKNPKPPKVIECPAYVFHLTHLLLCLTFEMLTSLVLPKGAFMVPALPWSFTAGDITTQ